jgi:cytosine/uracil/thiamine/allantoin permease
MTANGALCLRLILQTCPPESRPPTNQSFPINVTLRNTSSCQNNQWNCKKRVSAWVTQVHTINSWFVVEYRVQQTEAVSTGHTSNCH